MFRQRTQRTVPEIRQWLRDWELADQLHARMLRGVFAMTLAQIFERYPKLESFKISLLTRSVNGRMQTFPVVTDFSWKTRTPDRLPAVAAQAHRTIREWIAAFYHPRLAPHYPGTHCRDGSVRCDGAIPARPKATGAGITLRR